MAKEIITFRPKDSSILVWIRQQAQHEKRSVSNWMEIHFERLMLGKDYILDASSIPDNENTDQPKNTK